MAFNKYIYNLLLDNEVVIIPDFGAFVTSVIPSRTDIITGTLLPPSRIVRFDPKIRNNDWLLTNYIAEKEGITEHEAIKKIRKICDEILYRLDNGEKVLFENTGLLYFDNNKELCFEQDKEAVIHLDSYGLDPISITPEPELNDDKQTEQKSIEKEKSSFNFTWLFLFVPVLFGFFIVYQVWLKPVKKIGQPSDNKTIADSITTKDTSRKEKSDTINIRTETNAISKDEF